ncbi:helix-turn-helix domain-containing protein [Paenibacillus agricola]|uniref:AraC family transcriptional regulator n=1 Tax=Paenibacillus agricola TaxID=2716264 RepID=A0ABX0J5D4_9BACL|nr:helix-turn-helix domain-containing protein [Paenibacillus agricola]NHN31322.1 AraC family transcriptional regulator [Paenibacillus agricola]
MRIMIVDDEVIIRTGLAKVIKWDELGMELLEPAASAEEAIGRIPLERPNILLTDIRMTGKTGLQLAEEAIRILPDLEVIVLSGYDDFMYTQQAIRQGVSDYLLKTSRPEEIIKTVLKARQRIEEKWAAHSQDHFKYKEARNRMFERLITDGEAEKFDMPLLATYFPALFGEHEAAGGDLQIFIVSAEGWEESPSSSSLLLFAVDNMLQDLMNCESLLEKKRIVAAIRLGSSSENGMSHLRFIFQKVERLLKCKLFAAFGTAVQQPDQLHESYAAASEAFGYKLLINESIWKYEDIGKRKGGKTFSTHDEEIELSSILLEDDTVALKSWVQRFIQVQMEDPEVTIESLEALLHSVAISAHRWLERVVAATGRESVVDDRPAHVQLKLTVTPKDTLFQHLYAVMKLYHNRLGEGQATHAQKAMAYIEEHLGSDVGLQQVAKHVHLHPNHLSEVFKKEVGVTFGDYVTKQKIQRAMEILTISPAKISEVAYAVGYEDVKYFSQIFKKYTGKTPSEFREAAGSS